MAKTKAVAAFTTDEEKAITSAASRTWNYIAADAADIGVRSNVDAYELILDADRIVTLGGLDAALYARLTAPPIAAQNRLLRRLVGSLV